MVVRLTLADAARVDTKRTPSHSLDGLCEGVRWCISGPRLALMGSMKKLAAVAVVVVLSLTGCASTPDPYDVAWDTCVTAYEGFPNWLAGLAEQTGDPVTAETPCQNWVDSQGRDGFTAFWTDPDEYVPYIGTLSKLEDAGP